MAQQIQLVGDAVELIRKRPEQFFDSASPVSGDRLVALLLRDALAKGASDVHARAIDDWWTVRANVDWIATSGMTIENVFTQLLPLPSFGRNCHRSEVLVTAFASSIVTSAKDGKTTIADDGGLMSRAVEAEMKVSVGRIVAFRMP